MCNFRLCLKSRLTGRHYKRRDFDRNDQTCVLHEVKPKLVECVYFKEKHVYSRVEFNDQGQAKPAKNICFSGDCQIKVKLIKAVKWNFQILGALTDWKILKQLNQLRVVTNRRNKQQ